MEGLVYSLLMARKLGIQYPGALYHVTNRGGRREAIFKADPDRQRLLETLAECCQKTDREAAGPCLMPNHCHLVGDALREAVEAKPQWAVAEGLKRMGWTEADLARHHKADAKKVRLAHELRATTTMPLSCTEERLKMRSRGYLTWLLHRYGKPAK
jgi:REP element-mobilizing transposase RayT